MRINTNVLVLGLLVLIVAGSLSLFTNPYPIIDFSSSTTYQDNIIIPEGKMVQKADWIITPYTTQSSLKQISFSTNVCGSGSASYYGFYITPNQDIILYEVKQTRPSYVHNIKVYDSNNNLVCTLPETYSGSDIFRSNCLLKAGQTYKAYGDYYDDSRCIYYISQPTDNAFTLQGYPSSSSEIYVEYIKYYSLNNPKDVTVKIGEKIVFSRSGDLTNDSTITGLEKELNQFCNRPENKQKCTIPITFSVSQPGGKIKVNDTNTLIDIPLDNSLTSLTEPKFYQYRAFSKTTKIRSFRETIAERIKSIFLIFRKPSEPTLAYNTYGVSSKQPSNEEPPICKIIRIPKVCDQ